MYFICSHTHTDLLYLIMVCNVGNLTEALHSHPVQVLIQRNCNESYLRLASAGIKSRLGPSMANRFYLVSFILSIGTCKMRRFLAILRRFYHSSLLCTFSCHPSPPTILPSSLTSSCHLFLGLPLNLVVPKFIYSIFFHSLYMPKPR